MLLIGTACQGGGPTSVDDDPSPSPTVDTDQPVPLTTMSGMTYRGLAGHLYPGGNDMPSAHHTQGLQFASLIEPLDPSGSPSPSGHYVLVSIGMSNVTQEVCAADGNLPCDPWTFMGQAAGDPAVNSSHLVLVNGAEGGATAPFWDSPTDRSYDRVRDAWLSPMGLSELQVQAAWIKVANPRPSVSLPDPGADAYTLLGQLADIVRAAKVRYPNLKLVFVSSRTYAGYAVTQLNPEPYAYESGFSVKWLIEAQIKQMEAGGSVLDPLVGDLNYNGIAPWIAWGPYLWADGSNPNPDGLSWVAQDFEGDGTHPSRSGEEKVGTWLLDFFKTSPQTSGWFLE